MLDRSEERLSRELWIAQLSGQERESFEERFWGFVDERPADGCWLFTGNISGTGYGRMRVQAKHMGAHRIAFILAYGVVPVQRLVCHTCDERACVNPEHLYAGTFSDNLQDALVRGRRGIPDSPETQFPNGEDNPSARLTPDDVRDIRERAEAGETHVSLADEYSLSGSTVGRIVRREYWPQVN